MPHRANLAESHQDRYGRCAVSWVPGLPHALFSSSTSALQIGELLIVATEQIGRLINAFQMVFPVLITVENITRLISSQALSELHGIFQQTPPDKWQCMKHLVNFFPFTCCRLEAGDGAGRLHDDRREGGETLPHDHEQEPSPDQGSPAQVVCRPQVLLWKVSRQKVAPGVRLCHGARLHGANSIAALRG